ncbi:MAG: MarR family transcriptional regulator [Owenweeksia sp.]|nr:MarR family transcriptional regulator [Owenweeksia sp.]
MEIAEEIKRENFKNPYQKAAINLIYTSNWLSEQVRELLAEEGLTNQQFNVLRILRGSNPSPLSTLQIRERMLDKMSDTSRIVDRLVKKKLALKKTCQSDKRLVDVSITKTGLTMLEHIDQKEDRMYQNLYQLSEEDAELLSALCDKIRSGGKST